MSNTKENPYKCTLKQAQVLYTKFYFTRNELMKMHPNLPFFCAHIFTLVPEHNLLSDPEEAFALRLPLQCIVYRTPLTPRLSKTTFSIRRRRQPSAIYRCGLRRRFYCMPLRNPSPFPFHPHTTFIEPQEGSMMGGG